MTGLQRLSAIAIALCLLAAGCRAPGTPSSVAASPEASTSSTARADIGGAEVSGVDDDRPYVALPIRDVTVALDDSPRYEVAVEYPALDGATAGRRAFNRHLERLVTREVASFKAFCRREARRRAERDEPLGYSLRCSYAVGHASEEFVSLTLTWASFTGYLNEDYSSTPITFDLRRGEPVGLGDLFAPGSDYLERISAHCIAELRSTNSTIYDTGLWDLDESAGPRPENYHTWAVTRRGLQVTFGEYQVGPGVLGLVRVLVPYERLADIAAPDGPLAIAARGASRPAG